MSKDSQKSNLNNNEEIKQKIESAYRTLGANSFYDEMMTHSSYLGSFVDYIVWGYSKSDSDLINGRVLSYISENFSGKLLDVPVGTGILTIPFYSLIANADINCLDYSEEMLNQSREKAEKLNLKNIKFQQGDVGNLPYEDETFDIVLSMNGFHAFPDKEKAFSETFRVLKKGGKFCGCFYIKGQSWKTDFIVNNIYVKKGFFTPPFETLATFREKMEKIYKQVEIGNVKSLMNFCCIK
jgi:ubiquinone/menaquinone biosynthesis C-methylase UbiE